MLEPRRADFATHLMQALLGVSCWLIFAGIYTRKISGKIPPKSRRALFVCNHVSLLDTLLIGGILWSRRTMPMLVLGDLGTWKGGWLRRWLSWKLGFLIERGGIVRDRIDELKAFARSSQDFHLVVFPEGTRGDGERLAELQPGVYFVAKEAQIPIVPIRIRNMARLSSKHGGVHILGGLRQIEVEFGEPFEPAEYAGLRREAFMEDLRRRMEGGGGRL